MHYLSHQTNNIHSNNESLLGDGPTQVPIDWMYRLDCNCPRLTYTKLDVTFTSALSLLPFSRFETNRPTYNGTDPLTEDEMRNQHTKGHTKLQKNNQGTGTEILRTNKGPTNKATNRLKLESQRAN